jgi:hypothetical protein
VLGILNGFCKHINQVLVPVLFSLGNNPVRSNGLPVPSGQLHL